MTTFTSNKAVPKFCAIYIAEIIVKMYNSQMGSELGSFEYVFHLLPLELLPPLAVVSTGVLD